MDNNSDAPSLRESPKPRHDLAAVLGALYEREINCGLQSFWDGGWTVWIGDEMNGRRAEAVFDRGEHHLLGAWLAEAASEQFPCAEFPWERGPPALYRRAHANVAPYRPPLTEVTAEASESARKDGSSPKINEPSHD